MSKRWTTPQGNLCNRRNTVLNPQKSQFSFAYCTTAPKMRAYFDKFATYCNRHRPIVFNTKSMWCCSHRDKFSTHRTQRNVKQNYFGVRFYSLTGKHQRLGKPSVRIFFFIQRPHGCNGVPSRTLLTDCLYNWLTRKNKHHSSSLKHFKY